MEILFLIFIFIIVIGFIVDKREKDPLKEKIYIYRKSILKMTMVVAIILVVSSASVIFSFSYSNAEDENIIKKYVENEEIVKHIDPIIVENKVIEKSKIEVNFDYLKTINDETKGWLKVDDTNIEYPVVQTNNNDFYLNHSYDKKENYNGWIFVDFRNQINGLDKNLIIYGHNRINKTMFGTLKESLNYEWFNSKKDHFITFITPKYTIIYQIFSSYQIEVETYYLTVDFNTINYKEFLETIESRSKFDYNVEVNSNDKIMTLSTCYLDSNSRIVVHAKQININYN